jgi:hypothetical protein
VFLLNDVVPPGCGDHLLVVDVDQARDLSNRGSVAAELIGMDDLWDIVFSQQPGQEGLRRFGVPMPLKENVEHEAVLVNRSPKPVSNAIHAHTPRRYATGNPDGAPGGAGLPRRGVRILCTSGQASCTASVLPKTLAQSFMTDDDAVPIQQFLDVPVAAKRPHGRCSGQEAQWEAVVQPDGVLDDGHWESVAVWLGVGHGRSASLIRLRQHNP